MSSPWIEGLRSVALDVPDLERAETFYTEVWRLSVAARGPDAIYLRGTGADHHLLALHAARHARIRHVTLRARSAEALAAVAEAAWRPAAGCWAHRGAGRAGGRHRPQRARPRWPPFSGGAW